MIRRHFLALALAGGSLLGSSATAQPLDLALVVGSWRLTAVYDEFEDGRRRETWGANPIGIIQFSANGIFSAQIMTTGRTPRPGTVPSEPLGPAIAHWGTYTVDAPAPRFATVVQASTWPQWNGATIQRSIGALTPTRLTVVADPIPDPQGGRFRPHLEFERIP